MATKLSDCKIVRLSDCQIARLQDCKIGNDRLDKKSNRVEKGTFNCFFLGRQLLTLS